MAKTIYLDNAATTPVRAEVYEAMLPFFKDCYGNPSAVYGLAGISAKAVSDARRTIADAIGARNEEIFFTSGGTEADNWAIKSVLELSTNPVKHIISTKIEHKAILNSLRWMEKQGVQVTYVDVDTEGRVDPRDVERAIRPETVMISVMLANNEVGTIQPIEEIGEIAHKNKILFHTDAVQAFGHIPIDVNKLNIDMLSASAHKINGPKGVGLLYVKRDIRMPAFMHGGNQERGRRSGTTNVPGIVGMAEATRLAVAELDENTIKLTRLRDMLINKISDNIDGAHLCGSLEYRLPNNVHFCFEGIDSEALVLMLNRHNIYAAGGSACTTGNVEASHVLLALGVPEGLARGALRLSLGLDIIEDDIEWVVSEIKSIVGNLRGR